MNTQKIFEIAMKLCTTPGAAYNTQKIKERITQGLNPGDTLTLRNQQIIYIGNGMVRSEKDGKVIREGEMTPAELDNLLAAIAAKAG